MNAFTRTAIRKITPFACAACLLAVMTPTVFGQSLRAAELYNRAIDFYKQGNVAQALQMFEQATNADPSYTDAYYNIGAIHFHQGNFAAAEQAFGRLAGLNPGDFQAKYNLALAMEKQGKFSQARNLYQQIPAQSPAYEQARAKLRQLQATSQPATRPGENRVHQNPFTGSHDHGPGQQQRAEQYAIETFASNFDGPTGMAIGGDGRLYVANYSKNVLYRVTPQGSRETFAGPDGLSGPVGLVYNPEHRAFYAANYLDGTVSRIGEDGSIRQIATGLKKPYYLLLDTVNDFLYVTEQESNTVSRIRLD